MKANYILPDGRPCAVMRVEFTVEIHLLMAVAEYGIINGEPVDSRAKLEAQLRNLLHQYGTDIYFIKETESSEETEDEASELIHRLYPEFCVKAGQGNNG